MKIVSSKLLILALALLICLGAAGVAQAYAIYNHVGHHVCVQTYWSEYVMPDCKFTIPPHSTHNGGHGDNLSHVTVSWDLGHDHWKHNPDSFTIPHGGYARIYDGEVKVYKHNGDIVETRSIRKEKYATGAVRKPEN
ncbi:MAG: hypothetical protein KQH53_14470 [Desulfarculaceae bacterium]|nr:hypothetical protein [Desulfarculaceae bacterium]